MGSSAQSAANERSSVNEWLAAHRAQQIERLEAYAKAGEFPHNYGQPEAAHIFRDEGGRLCAVANLVHQDGRDDLVDATVREHNDLAIADVKEGGIFEWLLASGLTQEELVRVQLPAPPLTRRRVLRPSSDLIAQRESDAKLRMIPREIDEKLRMNEAVRQHIETVVRELRANTEASLNVATPRLVAHRDPAKAPNAFASN